VRLPIQFQDGKEMYNAVLAIIHKTSPVLSKMIHDNFDYNPFSLELPDIVNVIGLEIEPIFKELKGIEIIDEKSHVELLNTEYKNVSVLLQFHNTTFRTQGFDVPLPIPERILTSLKERWNQLYPEKLNIPIPFPGGRSKNRTIVKFANIHTTKHRIGEYHPFTAFYGKVGLKAFGDEDYIHQFNVLMRFAEFSGIGHKRPMGMGVVKILADGVEEK
jgi:CRISPR-associated endoribonuclease Cas6